jgi:hypothetical protein
MERKIYKEVVVSYVKILYRYLSGETEESYKTP